ncbi:family 4 glycosyl hydrolase [Mesobacillus foraminis]|uniref:Alpha-galactosidase n=1 Tax=Mesobacillus foraminis TaxID=279826 RepID=A0A4R2BAG4_9BACI|nr:alpha-glucosidase/alpha-galactosidase [Mesobacillus foraminis]TCN22539.1 alpha-galactosidase [Mesobacillus foraminis]
MNLENQRKNVQIAYIGGGSRGWAWGLMSDLAVEQSISGTVKLYDVNYEAAKQNERIGNGLRDREDVVGEWDYEAVPTLKEALTGADFVIISILPGTFQEMKSDVHTPEEYGIYQSVGDTVGPGGMVRALRTIPLFVEIAKEIREHSPNAWVINYTNPMSLCTRTLYEVFPEIKAFGCCHEVFGTQKLLAMMLEDMEGIENVQRSDIKVNVLGINHFTWLDQAAYKNIDLIPLYQKFVDKYYVSGFEGKKEGHWMNDHFASAQRVKFDLFKKFGLIAAAGDRHLAEFMPNTWYLKDREKVKEWKFGLTPVDWRIQKGKELHEKGKRLAQGEESFVLRPTGEEGVLMIKALLGLGDIVSNVNLPNLGQMEGVPQNSVVETNAVFGHNSVQPIVSGGLPAPINNMVLRHIHIQEMTLRAAIDCDRELALRAFTQDPLLSTLSPEEAEELFEKMLFNTKSYLPGWEFEAVKQ